METITRYQARLDSNGIYAIGTGWYSKVYNHPTHNDVVVKLLDDRDHAYIRFIKWAYANQGNPWVPKIYSIEEVKFCGYNPGMTRDVTGHLVFLEKLEGFYHPRPAHAELVSILATYVDPDTIRDLKNDIGRRPLCMSDVLDCWKWMMYQDKDSNLKQVIEYIYELSMDPCIMADLHTHNVMVRNTGNGYQLVFTDPVAPKAPIFSE